VFDLPILRVQAPLYRQGPGYKVAFGCPAAGFSVAAALAWVPLPSAPLPGRRLLYKVHLSPGPTYSGYMPPARLGSFRGEGFAWCGWWRPFVAGVTPVSSFCRSCRALASFNKAPVRDFVIIAGLSLQWRRSWSAAGAAGSLTKAGLFGQVSQRSLGRQPAGCSVFSLPR
jgi:hypothetical protein